MNRSYFRYHLSSYAEVNLATYEGAASLAICLSLNYRTFLREFTRNFPTKLGLWTQPTTPKTTLLQHFYELNHSTLPKHPYQYPGIIRNYLQISLVSNIRRIEAN